MSTPEAELDTFIWELMGSKLRVVVWLLQHTEPALTEYFCRGSYGLSPLDPSFLPQQQHILFPPSRDRQLFQ
jgi:hypothetical protein